MSNQQDPIAIARQAERDLNSQQAKGNTTAQSSGMSDSALDSGINEAATAKFPGSTVQIGSEASGRVIPPSEGGAIQESGRTTRAEDFEGEGGPEDKARKALEQRGGDDEIRENIRQGGETRRP